MTVLAAEVKESLEREFSICSKTISFYQRQIKRLEFLNTPLLKKPTNRKQNGTLPTLYPLPTPSSTHPGLFGKRTFYPGTSRKEITAGLQAALRDYKSGVKCDCGNPTWVIGSAVVGNGCFTCITGEAVPDSDYEIDVACQE